MSARDHGARTAPSWTIDVVLLLGILGLALAVFQALHSRFVLDTDVANLALGIERFDVHQHQPHPPGYLAYVLLLRAVDAVAHLRLLDTPRALSRLFALLAVVLSWRATRALASPTPEAPARGRGVALLAALLCATNPIILYYGVDGQTHSAEAAMSAWLVWALADRAALERWRRTLLVGVILAAGGSLRPSFALLSVLPVVYVYWFRLERLAVVGVVGALGTAAWLVPSVLLSGGWQRYRATSAALIGGLVSGSSPLNVESDARWVAVNLRDTVIWSTLAIGSAAAGYGWLRLRRRPVSQEQRRIGVLLLTMAAPAVAFYALVLCAEAGYVAGLVPPAAVATALMILPPDAAASRARVWGGLGLGAAQLAFFLFGPQAIGHTFMMPTVAEAIGREARTAHLWSELHRGLGLDDTVLVLSDWPDHTSLRQFPLQREGIEAAMFYSKRVFSLSSTAQMTVAQRHGWRSAPGDALNLDGDRRELTLATRFGWIALDPRSTPALRQALRAQTRCPVPEPDDRFLVPKLPATCLVGSDGVGTLRYQNFSLRFGVTAR